MEDARTDRRGIFVAKGHVVGIRPFQGTHGLEWEAGLAAVLRAEPTLAPEAADELRVLATFIRRPPPELEVIRLAHSGTWKSSALERSETDGASSSSTA